MSAMSVVLLLSTTILSMGFFRLIGMEYVGYIPLGIASTILLYGLWILYRSTPERQTTYAPYLQRQSLVRLLTLTLARAIHHRLLADRGFTRVIAITIFATLCMYSTIYDERQISQIAAGGYLFALLLGILTALWDSTIISIEMIAILTTMHRLLGMGVIQYRRHTRLTDPIDRLYKYITYIGYASMILVCFTYIDFSLAGLIITIILGSILISLPQETLDVTPDTETITAQDILEGRRVLDTSPVYEESPTRQHRRGIQPHHGLLLIWIIIAILTVTIIYQMIDRYTLQGAVGIRDVVGFVSMTILSISIFVLYYLSHRNDGRMTIWKIATIILTNIAIGIAIVHLFYPHTRTIVIASIIRNTINNLAMRGLYRSPYHHTLHAGEYYYRMIANTIITIINSILITTIFSIGNWQSTSIILLGYRGVQGALVYQIYNQYQSYDLTCDEIQSYRD